MEDNTLPPELAPEQRGDEDAPSGSPVETEVRAEPPPQETAEPEAVTLQQVATPTAWNRLRRLLGWAGEEERLNDLNRAIEEAPTAAVNYLLRGELYLVQREQQQAQADLEQAVALAEGEYAAADWGFGAQAVQDRALAGLRKLAATHPAE